MRRAQSPPHLGTLILITGVSVMSLTMLVPSMAHIGQDLQADYALVNVALGGYLAVSAVLQLIMGPLSDRFGRRPILLICMLVFAVASLGCALSPSIWSFLAFRLLQGAVVAGPVLAYASIRDLYPPNQAASKLGYVAMTMAVAPMLGPVLGGTLDVLFGWRSGFVLYAALGAGVLALALG